MPYGRQSSRSNSTGPAATGPAVASRTAVTASASSDGASGGSSSVEATSRSSSSRQSRSGSRPKSAGSSPCASGQCAATSPAAAIYAAAHLGKGESSLLRTIALPLLADVAEACGGLDWRPFGIRAVLPIAATQPAGEPIRFDQLRGRLARDLLERLGRADDDPELGEALDRWELSLFQSEPFRSEQLREALSALLGGADGLWAAAVRAAVLLGETGPDRAEQLERLRALARGEPAGGTAADAVRKALVEALAHGDRAALVDSLDDALIGVRPRPAGYYAALAS